MDGVSTKLKVDMPKILLKITEKYKSEADKNGRKQK
tara:strand:- start:605 stop:712 length:108 start_codon:yes stop_codon:yes gene_type:complete